jgi:hypothetical protein
MSGEYRDKAKALLNALGASYHPPLAWEAADVDFIAAALDEAERRGAEGERDALISWLGRDLERCTKRRGVCRECSTALTLIQQIRRAAHREKL